MSLDLATQPIDWHVRQAAELAMQTRRTLKADLQPMMHLILPTGHIQLVQFEQAPSGDLVALGARMTILEYKPRHAVLIQEGWTVKRSLMPKTADEPITDPDVRAVLAGALRPGLLPPHKRGEQLVIYGECADGSEAWAMYDIEGDQFVLSMSSWEWADLPTQDKAFVTKFRPLFLAEAMVRDLSVLDRTIMAVQSGGDEALLQQARLVAAGMLASGATGTPESFGADWDRAVARIQQHMGWRGAKR